MVIAAGMDSYFWCFLNIGQSHTANYVDLAGTVPEYLCYIGQLQCQMVINSWQANCEYYRWKTTEKDNLFNVYKCIHAEHHTSMILSSECNCICVTIVRQYGR